MESILFAERLSVRHIIVHAQEVLVSSRACMYVCMYVCLSVTGIRFEIGEIDAGAIT